MKSNGKMINPNDPEENSEMFAQNMTPNQAPSTPSRAESQGKQSTKVPQFGAWEDGDNVGYTAYFENARKNKKSGSKKAENQAQGQGQAEAQEPQSKVPQFGEWNEGDDHNVGYSAYFENPRKKKNNDASGAAKVEPQLNRDVADQPKTQLNRDVADQPKTATKTKSPGGGGGGGVDQKPTKEESPVRNTSRDSPPSFDGSEAPSGNGRQTPGGQTPQHPRGGSKTQSKPVSGGSQNSEKAAAIPPFGVWNTDPQAEGFTGAFIRAREDKNTPLHHSAQASRHQNSKTDEPKKGWCFCCFG